MAKQRKESNYIGQFCTPSPADYGWSKIAEVTIEIDRDQTGKIIGEYIHMLTTDGEWFMLDGIRKDDPAADDLANFYRARGWTDARCLYMGKAA